MCMLSIPSVSILDTSAKERCIIDQESKAQERDRKKIHKRQFKKKCPFCWVFCWNNKFLEIVITLSKERGMFRKKNVKPLVLSSCSLKASSYLSSPNNVNESEPNLAGEVSEDVALHSVGRRRPKQEEFPWKP